MRKERKFEEIVTVCLERIIRGEPVEQCLKDYPEQAGELEPLLKTALAARAVADIQPGSEFKTRARNEFLNAMRERSAVRERPASFFRWHWRWQPAWSIALAVLLVVVLSGGGTVMASRNSMPGSPLYSIKLLSENTRLAFTFSDTAKAELNSEFAENRAEEIVYAAARDDVENVRNTADNLHTSMSNVAVLTSNSLGEAAARNSEAAAGDIAAGGLQSAAGGLQSAAGGLQSAAGGLDNTAGDVQMAQPQAVPAEKAAPMLDGVPETATVIPPEEKSVRGFRMAADEAVPETSPLAENNGNAGGEDEAQEPALEAETYGLSQDGDVENSLTEEGELQNVLTENYILLQAYLEEALETASPEARPIIREAIAHAQAEYIKSMSNLEILDYMNRHP
ncbi:MAG: hypothetical protein JXA46_15910 [Dehalococcoidales bacterium]|nr:hypothetical protein [Dehalococcoidales bacterium]